MTFIFLQLGPGSQSTVVAIFIKTKVSTLFSRSVMSDSSAIEWTVAHQAPLSMGFSRQEYWSRLPCPAPEDLPDPGMEPISLMSPALAGGFFPSSTSWEGNLPI